MVGAAVMAAAVAMATAAAEAAQVEVAKGTVVAEAGATVWG
jgi:hypothetical protein